MTYELETVALIGLMCGVQGFLIGSESTQERILKYLRRFELVEKEFDDAESADIDGRLDAANDAIQSREVL